MVTSLMRLISLSSRLQYGQSASAKMTSLREPLPLTRLKARFRGSELQAMRLSSRCRASVRFLLVLAS